MKQAFRLREFFTRSKKKVEITVETIKTLKIKRQIKGVQGFCQTCQRNTLFITFNETEFMSQTDKSTAEKLLTKENLHFAMSPTKQQLVCIDSVKLKIEKSFDTRD